MLLLDDDTVRTWYLLYQEDGIEGLASFGYEGGACRLNPDQQDKLTAWIGTRLPRTTREVGAWIARLFNAVGFRAIGGVVEFLRVRRGIGLVGAFRIGLP